MKYKIVILILFLIAVVFGGYVYFFADDDISNDDLNSLTKTLPSNPLNATYELDGEDVTLNNGFATTSDGGELVSVGDVSYGDLNNDTDEDSAFILKKKNGDKISYFVVPAIKDGEGFLGLKSAFLGENKDNLSLSIEDGLIVVDDNGFTRYFKILGISITEIEQISDTERVLKGNFKYSEDEKKFTECGTGNTYNVSEESHSLAALKAIYDELSKNGKSSVYIVAVGKFVEEGEYKVLEINRILSAPKNGGCMNIVETKEEIKNKLDLQNKSPQL